MLGNFILSFFITSLLTECESRSFTIDFDNDVFLLNGKPFSYTSGSLHYFRVPYFYWADRLNKMAAAGLDAVQTYVAWNLHEPKPSVYDFTLQQDLASFLKQAQEAGLFVILRPGPYICAEWDYGGLPAWLLATNSTFKVRTMDRFYIDAVSRWFHVLMELIQPFLYFNGGPIIMVQVENEYGSYDACDHDYMNYLAAFMRSYLGNNIVLFTTDGNDISYLKCGYANNTYATVDFGVTNDVQGAFSAMKKWNKRGPLVNSEFYTGWLDYWGIVHSTTATTEVIKTLTAMQNINASVNMYMFEGGTNFQFMNGVDPAFQVIPTSYDYDAPLSEAGDITDKYLAIRQLMSQKKSLPLLPKNTSKADFGIVKMRRLNSLLHLLDSVITHTDKRFFTHLPQNAEQIQHFYGFIIYRHIFKSSHESSLLQIPGLRDRAYILLNMKQIGILDRSLTTSLIMGCRTNQTLDIIIENQGRINYGVQITDNKKGILGNVTLGKDVLTNWEMIPLNLTRIFDLQMDNKLRFFKKSEQFDENNSVESSFPAIYFGIFSIPDQLANKDTFLYPCGWVKGQALINGFNLGRYNPTLGPQVTLYVPSGYLRPTNNLLIMLELEATTSKNIQLIDRPIIDSKCFYENKLEKFKNKSQVKYKRQG